MEPQAKGFDELLAMAVKQPCPVPQRKDGTPKRRGKRLSTSDNMCRDVYRVTQAGKDYALKFARPGYEYANIAEAGVWQAVVGTPFAAYFAPVVAAAADGSWLLQEFVDGTPAWWDDEDDVFELEDVLELSDMHAHNFLYAEDGHQVAFDYGGYLVNPRKYVTRVARRVKEELDDPDGWLYTG